MKRFSALVVCVCLLLSTPAFAGAAGVTSFLRYKPVATWSRPGADWARLQSGIDVAPDGTIYVVNGTRKSVHVYSATGVHLTEFTGVGAGGALVCPSDVSVDASSTVWVVDRGANLVRGFDAMGTAEVARMGGKGSGDGQLNDPIGVGIGPDGDVWVADSGNRRVQRFSSGGEFEAKYAAPAYDVAVAPSGEWYVAFGLTMSRYAADGRLIGTWGSTDPSHYEWVAWQVDIDEWGRLVVPDSYTLHIFSPNGTHLDEFGRYATDASHFFRAAATAPGGHVYAVEDDVISVWQRWSDGGYETLEGPDRFATSVEVSKRLAATDIAVIAAGRGFADALVAGPLAQALGGPVLLTERDSLPSVVANRIRTAGIKRAVIVGGPEAVGGGVQRRLEELGVRVEQRLSGRNRYDTARLVAIALKSASGMPDGVYLATGAAFPDALCGSSLAAYQGRPVLLVTVNGVPSETRQALDALALPAGSPRIALGGNLAIPPTVATAAGATRRISGKNRYETAVAIAREAWAQGMDDGGVVFATGEDYPDALVASRYCAANAWPLVLTSDSGASSATFLGWSFIDQRRSELDRVTVVGGKAALRPGTAEELADHLRW